MTEIDTDKLRKFIDRAETNPAAEDVHEFLKQLHVQNSARTLTERYLWENRAAILAMAEEIKELRDCLGFWAARQTCEEALADTTPAPWRNCSPQQRLEIIGARKELHDSEVLKARRALGKDKA